MGGSNTAQPYQPTKESKCNYNTIYYNVAILAIHYHATEAIASSLVAQEQLELS